MEGHVPLTIEETALAATVWLSAGAPVASSDVADSPALQDWSFPSFEVAAAAAEHPEWVKDALRDWEKLLDKANKLAIAKHRLKTGKKPGSLLESMDGIDAALDLLNAVLDRVTGTK